MKPILAGILFLVIGCSHLIPSRVYAREAARAALNVIDPKAELTIAFGPGVDVKTQRLLRGLRPPATNADAGTLANLPANVARIDRFIVAADKVTVSARKGNQFPRSIQHSLACGTGYTLTLRKDEHGWILDRMTIDVC